MKLIYLRDNIFNFLICWLAKHCVCYGSTFYAICDQYHPSEVKAYSEMWLRAKEK